MQNEEQDINVLPKNLHGGPDFSRLMRSGLLWQSFLWVLLSIPLTTYSKPMNYFSDRDLEKLIKALSVVESNNNPKAVGRRGEVGCLQITQAVVDDYNRAHPSDEELSLHDMFYPSIAQTVCLWYLRHYGEKSISKTGTLPTFETLARVWNGGPDGAVKTSTLAYWVKVQNILNQSHGTTQPKY